MRCLHDFVLEAGQGEVYMYIVDCIDVLTIVVANRGAMYLVLHPMLSREFAFVMCLPTITLGLCIKLYDKHHLFLHYIAGHVR